MSGHYLIVRSRAAWIRQARESYERLVAKGAADNVSLREMADLDRDAFGQMIEALIALGVPADEEIRRLAGLRPVDEVLA